MRKLILLLLSLLPIMGLYGEPEIELKEIPKILNTTVRFLCPGYGTFAGAYFGAYLGDKGGRKAGAFIYDFLYQ